MDSLCAKRKNDAVIAVSQDNETRRLTITGMNHAAERLTGHPEADLKDTSFTTLLPDAIQEDLVQYLDYHTGGKNLAHVLRKEKEFSILTKEGEAIPCDLKIFHVISSDLEHPCFELLLRDQTLITHINALKEKLQGTVSAEEAQTSYAGPELFYSNLELVISFVQRYHIEASMGFMMLDQYVAMTQQGGDPTLKNFSYDAMGILQRTLREGDMLAYLDNGLIGVLLLDCNTQDAQSVLNRLRMMVESEVLSISSGQNMPSTISSSYMQLSGDEEISDMVRLLATALEKAQSNGGNVIVLGG